ncbi:MAG TPA: hypothetical protein VJU77_14930 [Chthoniobacterales bacterium]|nr:hypothetical protein [Chthoniobacterales bacterium]
MQNAARQYPFSAKQLMVKFLSVLWVAAVSFAMLLSLLLCAGELWRVLYWGVPATRLPEFAGSILLSGATVLYAAVELWRWFYQRRPLLPRVAVVAVTLLGFVTSVLLVPMAKKRSADTRIIPELAFTQQERLDRAISELNQAKTEEERFYALGDAARESFIAGNIDDARRYAEELRALAPKFDSCWNYGNAIQNANLVLGRIAICEKRIDDAKRHLLEAGKSPGSPQMNSFGPNMSLAKDLLEIGEREVVLQYFELCRKFWSLGGKQLDQWSAEVQTGRIPDFGANLFY